MEVRSGGLPPDIRSQTRSRAVVSGGLMGYIWRDISCLFLFCPGSVCVACFLLGVTRFVYDSEPLIIDYQVTRHVNLISTLHWLIVIT